jgi:hypothetical protein
LLGRPRKLAGDYECIVLLEAEKESLYRNRKLNWAAFRLLRISTREFIIFPRRKGKKNSTDSRI